MKQISTNCPSLHSLFTCRLLPWDSTISSPTSFPSQLFVKSTKGLKISIKSQTCLINSPHRDELLLNRKRDEGETLKFIIIFPHVISIISRCFNENVLLISLLCFGERPWDLSRKTFGLQCIQKSASFSASLAEYPPGFYEFFFCVWTRRSHASVYMVFARLFLGRRPGLLCSSHLQALIKYSIETEHRNKI